MISARDAVLTDWSAFSTVSSESEVFERLGVKACLALPLSVFCVSVDDVYEHQFDSHVAHVLHDPSAVDVSVHFFILTKLDVPHSQFLHAVFLLGLFVVTIIRTRLVLSTTSCGSFTVTHSGVSSGTKPAVTSASTIVFTTVPV